MPRTEVYQLRLTRSEKDELAARARLQGISIAKLIRERLKLDAKHDDPSEDLRRAMSTAGIAAGIAADKARALDTDRFKALVAKHKPFMSTRAAEALARKELSS